MENCLTLWGEKEKESETGFPTFFCGPQINSRLSVGLKRENSQGQYIYYLEYEEVVSKQWTQARKHKDMNKFDFIKFKFHMAKIIILIKLIDATWQKSVFVTHMSRVSFLNIQKYVKISKKEWQWQPHIKIGKTAFHL